MSEDRNGKTYSFDVCSACTITCCQDANPPLTANRKKVITEYLKQQKMPFQNVFAGEEYSHPATDQENICVFYNRENRRCRVHSVKPETCRAGPITFDINLKTRKVEWFLKKGEICNFAPCLHENKQHFSDHFEAAKTELMRLICELDAGSLKAILKIAEPETFKVGENELPTEVMDKLGLSC